MATITTHELAPAASVEVQSHPGLLRRFFNAMVEARHRAAEREIERYILTHGGVLTDRLEQDLSRTFGSPAGRGY